MSNKKNQFALPLLRFPEFQEAQHWKRKRIDDEGFATFHKGKGIAKSDIRPNGFTPCIRYGELYTQYGEVIEAVISKTDLPKSKLFFSQSNDVIIPSSGETRIDIATASCVLADNVALGGDLNVVRPSQNGVFLSYYLNGPLKREIAKLAQGNAVVHLYLSQLKKVELFLTEPEEQQKIAECLTSIDTLITAKCQKLTALREHKKGLMQHLFPKKNGTTPHLRFPEFKNTKDWEETTIGSIGSFYYGKSAPKWSLEKDARTPCVRYGELYTKFGPIIEKTYSRTNIDPQKLRFSKGGEILVPRVGERPEEFGKCCSYLPLANIAIGEMISVFETEENPLFYTYYFRNLYAEFAKVVEGQNVKNLYYAVLEPLRICRPSPKEQQTIADFLHSIEEQIITHVQKIDSLRIHKKGLMQQLFPSPGELSK